MGRRFFFPLCHNPQLIPSNQTTQINNLISIDRSLIWGKKTVFAIDELNSEIRLEDDTRTRIGIAVEMEQAIRVIKEIDALKLGTYARKNDVFHNVRGSGGDYV